MSYRSVFQWVIVSITLQEPLNGCHGNSDTVTTEIGRLHSLSMSDLDTRLCQSPRTRQSKARGNYKVGVGIIRQSSDQNLQLEPRSLNNPTIFTIGGRNPGNLRKPQAMFSIASNS